MRARVIKPKIAKLGVAGVILRLHNPGLEGNNATRNCDSLKTARRVAGSIETSSASK